MAFEAGSVAQWSAYGGTRMDSAHSEMLLLRRLEEAGGNYGIRLRRKNCDWSRSTPPKAHEVSV